MKKLYFLFLLALPTLLSATHNRAGEITYTQTSAYTIIATVTTYTKASSLPADRDSLYLCWGDAACEWVLRTNGPIGTAGIPSGELLSNDIKKNEYRIDHTYADFGDYQLAMVDPNRNNDILNINNGNSGVAFAISTNFILLDPSIQGLNQSPTLLFPPIDNGNVGEPFIHSPAAYDSDGDRLSFELVTPQVDTNNNVPNYIFPDQIMPGPDNTISLDPITGEFRWEFPQMEGEYNIAIRVSEYRDGVLLSSTIRDMQIKVWEEVDRPPSPIQGSDYITVNALEALNYSFAANDPDQGQLVRVSAAGGPFVVAGSKASKGFTADYQSAVPFASFSWTPDCEHVREEPYLVVLKVEDDYTTLNGDSAVLATLKTIQIKVNAPATGCVLANEEFSRDAIALQTYPNPVKDQLTIALAASRPQVVTLVLTDVSGRVLVVREEFVFGEDLLGLDLSEVEGGVYFLRVEMEDGVGLRKVVVGGR